MRRYQHKRKADKLNKITSFVSDYKAANGVIPNGHEINAHINVAPSTFRALMNELRGRGIVSFSNWDELYKRTYSVNEESIFK